MTAAIDAGPASVLVDEVDTCDERLQDAFVAALGGCPRRAAGTVTTDARRVAALDETLEAR